MIGTLQENWPIRDTTIWVVYPAAPPGNDYQIICKYRMICPELHACFVLCYFDAVDTEEGISTAVNSRSIDAECAQMPHWLHRQLINGEEWLENTSTSEHPSL
jgi:hypothetical protein